MRGTWAFTLMGFGSCGPQQAKVCACKASERPQCGSAEQAAAPIELESGCSGGKESQVNFLHANSLTERTRLLGMKPVQKAEHQPAFAKTAGKPAPGFTQPCVGLQICEEEVLFAGSCPTGKDAHGKEMHMRNGRESDPH